MKERAGRCFSLPALSFLPPFFQQKKNYLLNSRFGSHVDRAGM
jgi:hypothetical protein